MSTGRKCEGYIRSFFPIWKKFGWLPFQNHKRVAAGKFVEGEPYVFTLVVPKCCVFLEAKETEKDVFKVSGTRLLEQANSLLAVQKLGHVSLYVVAFRLKGVATAGLWHDKKEPMLDKLESSGTILRVEVFDPKVVVERGARVSEGLSLEDALFNELTRRGVDVRSYGSGV